MASQADDEVPLIYSTQTAATVADLEMEDENKEPSYYTLPGEGMGQELNVSISFTGAVTPNKKSCTSISSRIYYSKSSAPMSSF